MKTWFVRPALTIAALAIGLAVGGSAEARPRCSSGCSDCASAPSCGVQYQTVQRTIMVPETSWEVRQVPVTVCRPEVRQHTVTVMKPVYETKAVTHQYTVMEPQQRTRVVHYTVCTPVYENVERQISIMVPEQQVRQGVRQVCQPYQEQVMRTVCRDAGYFEERQVAADCGSACDSCGRRCGRRSRCGDCGGCTSPCAPTYTTCRVWVPNIVEEQVPVNVWKTRYVDEPFEYTVTVCKPQVQTINERVCRIQREQKSREITFTVAVPKVMSKTVDVRTCRYVPEPQQRDVTVMVPQTEMREVRVQVCNMVPKVIDCQVPIYNNGCDNGYSGCGNGYGDGCGNGYGGYGYGK